jgi:hypothetical protein
MIVEIQNEVQIRRHLRRSAPVAPRRCRPRGTPDATAAGNRAGTRARAVSGVFSRKMQFRLATMRPSPARQ